MYVPEWFKLTDSGLIRQTIAENSFATVVSMVEGELFASHVPVVIEQDDPLTLVGHVAAQNPQSSSFNGSDQVLIVFSGPHAYVSPRLYTTSPNVPTWNYVAVHASGTAVRLEEPSEVVALLDRLVSTFDPELAADMPENTAPQFYASKLKGIVAFRMVVQRLEAKAKMSQNKPDRDRSAVKAALEASDDSVVRRAGESMRE